MKQQQWMHSVWFPCVAVFSVTSLVSNLCVVSIYLFFFVTLVMTFLNPKLKVRLWRETDLFQKFSQFGWLPHVSVVLRAWTPLCCCILIFSLYPQPQTTSSRWHQVKPLETPQRPAQRRAGQAHQPAALHRGGQVSAGQAVRAPPQRRVPEGQELLQRWVSKLWSQFPAGFHYIFTWMFLTALLGRDRTCTVFDICHLVCERMWCHCWERMEEEKCFLLSHRMHHSYIL